MCGACATPHDPMAPLVSGPRRRTAIAVEAARQLPKLRIRVVARAWTVADRTGRVKVCASFEELLGELGRHGWPCAVAKPQLLQAAASVAKTGAAKP